MMNINNIITSSFIIYIVGEVEIFKIETAVTKID